MALERNNTVLEFEMMLRRHLKNGGGPVSACSGFDPDAASAYLEGVMGSAALLRYQTHLAGCPACRRHIIELSHLSQVAALDVAAASPVAVETGWWSLWKSAVAGRLNGWFDISAWRWNWRIAGTALTASAVLIVAIVIQPWRQSIERGVGTTSNVMVGTSTSQVPAPSPALSSDVRSQDSSSPSASAFAGNSTSAHTPHQASVPAPQVSITPAPVEQAEQRLLSTQPTDALNSPNRAIASKTSPLSGLLDSTEPVQPPTISVRESAKQRAVTLPNQSASNEVQERATAEPSLEPREFQYKTGRHIVQRIEPSPDDNPMRNVANSPNGRSDSKPDEKALPQPQRPDWTTRVWGYMTFRKIEQEKKTTVATSPADKADKDDQMASPMIRRIRDKTFFFQRGTWIDVAYKQEKMGWRVTRLVQDSNEYHQVLSENPQLMEFFSLGKVIVVWRDKVYRVIVK